MAETKLKQYIAEFFVVDEIKNGKAPTRTTRVLAKNLKEAREQLWTASRNLNDAFITISVKLDKGQGKPGRKPNHKLTKNELAQVEILLNPPNAPKVKKVEPEWDEVKAFKDSDKVALASLDALANDEPMQGTKKSDKAAEVIDSIGVELEEKGSCPACGDDNWDENDNCVTCYAIGVEDTALKLVGDVDDMVQPTIVPTTADIAVAALEAEELDEEEEKVLEPAVEEVVFVGAEQGLPVEPAEEAEYLDPLAQVLAAHYEFPEDPAPEGEDASLTCPTCSLGTDDDGDGDCAVCTSPAYLQALSEQPLTDEEAEQPEPPTEEPDCGWSEPTHCRCCEGPSVTGQALIFIALLVTIIGIVMYLTR